ncbi:Cellulose synthase catalytic subunit [UDP-forming] [Roseivivax jejudonensis]|uniref:Cellulose synthase catalytic subunit [UDP-forming] n=1 Tax=Roseivivax jejudonensis TaxID=1529041 RepID=A0A1X6ZSV4_9RHOB|nr:cellulose synthase catalytic subunit [Roseivivax jejudonensis]SLN60336.1 Cellulose synthase catalytic subunit [UDP-forming] [Roseivivax jejudonensis]
MTAFPHLGQLGAAYIQVLLVAGIGLLLPFVADRNRASHRVVLYGITIFMALRYAFWRATETLAPVGLTIDFIASGTLFVLEMLALAGSLSACVLMMRRRDRSPDADAHAGWWGAHEPRVAILIATYNEEMEVLERTIIGAKSLRHANKEVIVLDDGRRDWLRDYCAAQDVRYMRRPDNKGSKAGNINHALERLAEDAVPPDFVAVLDADFVPHRGFISRSLALFHDPSIGLVQTPQHFFNADPLQNNLGLTRSYPDEQRFFFDHMQASRDGWGIAICCGTSSVARYSALIEIGGMSTDSVTEDFLLSLTMQSHGYQTAYLNEPLTEGLAPEGLKEYVTQRARWCLGLMQIARSPLGPFRRNALRLRDRWSVIDSVFYWLPSFIFRLAVVVFPLLYWYFNVIVVDAPLDEVLIYFATYYLWAQIVMNLMAPLMILPILHDVSQLIGAIPISRAAIVGLLKPKGHPFSVTAKGGDRSRIVVQWRMMAPFAVLLSLTIGGLILGIFSDRFAYSDAGDGKWVVLFWTIYNLIVLSVTVIACIELPRRERHVADAPERARFDEGAAVHEVWLTSMTADTARIRGRRYPAETRGTLEIADVGPVEAYVISETRDGARVQLLPDAVQREALFVRFYADGAAPGVGNVRLSAMVSDLARRLSFSSGGR